MLNKLDLTKRLQLMAYGAAAGTVVSEYIGQRYFARVLVFAVILHVVAFYGWHLMPKTEVIDIPVRALNIKLGEIDTPPDSQPDIPRPESTNSAEVENTLSKLVNDVVLKDEVSKSTLNTEKPVAPPKTEQAVPVRQSQDYLSKLSAAPKQFVRDNKAAKAKTIVTGNSNASNAEIMRRYEQLISLWIQKFKIYPEQARAQNMQGETVVRIRIDRQGNIRYYILERSTGYQILDRAAIDMIRRANPVPAVPHNYPPGDLMEFLIPVTFHLQ